QGILETGAAVLPLVHDPIDVLELGVFLVAQAGVDEHEAVVVLDQETTQREGDAVAVVRGNAPLPQRLGYDAEHGAAVEALGAALQGMAGEAAHLKGRVGHQKSERGTRNAEPSRKVGRSLTHSLMFRVPTSAFRVFLCRVRSCSSLSSSSVSTPRSRARPSKARRMYAVASASPKARWRAGFSTPKNAATCSSRRWRSSGTRRRVSRMVQSGAPCGAGSPAAAHSPARKPQSKRALWATKIASSSTRPRPGATSAKRGRPTTIGSVIPVRRATAAGTGMPGSSSAS